MKFRTAYYHCEEFLETMVALKQADYLKYQKKIRFHMKLDLLILDNMYTLNQFGYSLTRHASVCRAHQ